MKKGLVLLFISFILLGILANSYIVMAEDDNNSNSGNSENSTNNSGSDNEDEERDDDEDDEDDENETEIDDEDDDDEENEHRLRIREAIHERNRLGLNDSNLPEGCSRTGSVLRCDIERKIETSLEIEGIDALPQELMDKLNELRTSINDTEGETKIKIKAEKDGDEIQVESESEGALDSDQEALLEDIVERLRGFLENAEQEEIKIEIELRHRFRERRVMIVEAGSSGNTIVKFGDSEFKTRIELYHHNGEIYGRFGENETRLIDLLPEELQERIRERIRARLEFHNETVELNEEGEYEVEADKDSRFLGVLKIKEKVRFHVDPETGEVLNVRSPWWGFLASDVEETED